MAKKPTPKPANPKMEVESYQYDWRTRNNLKRGTKAPPKGKC